MKRADMPDSEQTTRKADRTKALILEAAKKRFGVQGFSGASVGDIAKDAGVSKGVLYYHFSNKEEIAVEVLRQAFVDLYDSFQQAAQEAPNAGVALRGMLNAFAGYLFDNQEIARFILSEIWRGKRAWSDDLTKMVNQLADLIQDQLTRGIAEGIFRPEMDVHFTAVATIGTVLTMSQYCLSLAGDGQPGHEENHQVDRELFVGQIVEYVAPALDK